MFGIKISVSDKDNIKHIRENKGNSIIAFPDEYIIFDLETTGLDPDYDEIIEIGAIKIKNNEIIDKFNTLVKPQNEIDEFITELTGITNEMLENAPLPDDIIPKFIDFIGSSILMGYNVNFDINFVYDYVDDGISNNFIDLLRYARKLLPKPTLENHRLVTVAKHFDINTENSHRAYDDCVITFDCYKCFCKLIDEKYENQQNFVNIFNSIYKPPKSKDIKPETTVFDTDNPFYEKRCCFTGELEKMTRRNAMQAICNLGAVCEDNVTKKTNYLILGNFNYSNTKEKGKSSKLLKAEKNKLNGNDIEIISENVFYELLQQVEQPAAPADKSK